MSERAKGKPESRREAREPGVHALTYRPFPPAGASGADSYVRVGRSRDLSSAGIGIDVDESLPVGSFVRLVVAQADERPDLDFVARVAWCRENDDPTAGAPRRRMGLSRVAEVKRSLGRVGRAAPAATPTAG